MLGTATLAAGIILLGASSASASVSDGYYDPEKHALHRLFDHHRRG